MAEPVLLFYLKSKSKYSLIWLFCFNALGDSADNAKMIKPECFGTLKTIFATLITKKVIERQACLNDTFQSAMLFKCDDHGSDFAWRGANVISIQSLARCHRRSPFATLNRDDCSKRASYALRLRC